MLPSTADGLYNWFWYCGESAVEGVGQTGQRAGYLLQNFHVAVESVLTGAVL